MNEFVDVKTCYTPVEAEYFRSYLELNSIQAFVEGSHVNTTLSHVGGALGGTRVYVHHRDANQALLLIDKVDKEARGPSDDWYCGECRETMGKAFDICWSCGNDRSDVEAPFPVATEPATDESTEIVAIDPRNNSQVDPSNNDSKEEQERYNNPYFPPGTANSLLSSKNDDTAARNIEIDATVQRAWRAAVIGLLFLPVICQVYSMCILVYVAALNVPLSPKASRQYNYTMALNVAYCIIFALIASQMRW